MTIYYEFMFLLQWREINVDAIHITERVVKNV